LTNEIHQRIVREATPEEKDRHRAIREEIEQELPELKQWARETAARHRERVAVGTVFTSEETPVLEAIDDYAAKHSLPGRGAVVREALAQLLGLEIPRSGSGGRTTATGIGSSRPNTAPMAASTPPRSSGRPGRGFCSKTESPR
jgi:hypothetical protein